MVFHFILSYVFFFFNDICWCEIILRNIFFLVNVTMRKFLKLEIGRYLFNPTEEQFIASMEIHLKRFGPQTFWVLNQAQRLP
jgi:hypothetical protein